MKTIIRATSAHDFLAMVPALAGFTPVQSLVVIAFRGSRSCGVLRVDLPRTARPGRDAVSALASSVVGMLCKIPDVDGLVAVVYTSARFGAGASAPQQALVRAVLRHAGQSGFAVRDALCVAADGWASYLDAATPRGGHPLRLVADSTVAAGAPAELAARALHDQGGPELVRRPVGRGTVQRVGRMVSRFRAVASDPDALGEPSAELAVLLDLAAVAERGLLGPVETLDDLHAAALVFAVQNPGVRDELLLQWAFGREARDVETGASLLGGEGPRPDAKRVEAAIALLLELATRSARRYHPPVYSMMAWLNWALGRSSRAGTLLGLAQRIDARYSFAELLDAMVRSGRVPEWAFAVPPEPAGSDTANGGAMPAVRRSARPAGSWGEGREP